MSDDIKFTKKDVIFLTLNLKILQELNKGKLLYTELGDQIKMLENGDHWGFLEKNNFKDLFPLEKKEYDIYLSFINNWSRVVDELKKHNVRLYDFNIHIDYHDHELVNFLDRRFKEMKNGIKLTDSHGILFDFSNYLDFSEVLNSRYGKNRYDIDFITDYLNVNEFPIIE